VAATCAAGPGHLAFTPRERLLLQLVDELHETAQVSDALWEALRATWTEAQLVELVALVGFYHLIAFVTNAFRISPESYAPRFPQAG
jgi:alkylhydroperoxidase family enzyme